MQTTEGLQFQPLFSVELFEPGALPYSYRSLTQACWTLFCVLEFNDDATMLSLTLTLTLTIAPEHSVAPLTQT